MSISLRTPSARRARYAPRVLLALLAAGLVASATSTPTLAQGKDDLWEITTKMEMPGMPMAMPAQTQRLCVAKGGKDDDYIPKREGCRVQDSKRVGNKVSYRMVCTGKDSMTVAGETKTVQEWEFQLTGLEFCREETDQETLFDGLTRAQNPALATSWL